MKGWLTMCVLACLLVGCEGGIGGTGGVAPPNAMDGVTETIDVAGQASKGPFAEGSAVEYVAIAANGSRSTTVALGETGTLGEFTGVLPGGVAEISVTGVYVSENLGVVSGEPLTLRSLWSGAGTANVNVLGHMTADRTRTLMSEGMGVLNAQSTALAELTESLRPLIPPPTAPLLASEVSVLRQFGGDPAGDAYLLTLSAIIERYALDQTTSTADATRFLAILLDGWSDDLAADGVLDLTGELPGLRAARRAIRPDEIYTNLLQADLSVTDAAEDGLGLTGDFSCEATDGELSCVELTADAAPEPANDVLTVRLSDLLPDMERFLDTDGDGIPNDVDTDDDDDGVPDDSDGDRFDDAI